MTQATVYNFLKIITHCHVYKQTEMAFTMQIITILQEFLTRVALTGWWGIIFHWIRCNSGGRIISWNSSVNLLPFSINLLRTIYQHFLKGFSFRFQIALVQWYIPVFPIICSLSQWYWWFCAIREQRQVSKVNEISWSSEGVQV